METFYNWTTVFVFTFDKLMRDVWKLIIHITQFEKFDGEVSMTHIHQRSVARG